MARKGEDLASHEPLNSKSDIDAFAVQPTAANHSLALLFRIVVKDSNREI
jgi:hypothetical protein